MKERGRWSDRGEKAETGRGRKIQREERVCEQGLRPSVCCRLSSEVDDALGEQMRCRAFRLHHYCSPSSSSNTHSLSISHTHTTTHNRIHTNKHTHSSHEHAKAMIVASVLPHECLLTGFYMPGQARKSDIESHVPLFRFVWNIPNLSPILKTTISYVQQKIQKCWIVLKENSGRKKRAGLQLKSTWV